MVYIFKRYERLNSEPSNKRLFIYLNGMNVRPLSSGTVTALVGVVPVRLGGAVTKAHYCFFYIRPHLPPTNFAH